MSLVTGDTGIAGSSKRWLYSLGEHSDYIGRLNGKKERITIFARVGPVSSLHDRACEIFYALLGGTGWADDHEAAMAPEGLTNDGVVPLFSQWHPFRCSATQCRQFSAESKTDITALDAEKYRGNGAPESGIWHVHHIDDAHHPSLVPLWLGTARQKLFWRDVGLWLSAIDRETETQIPHTLPWVIGSSKHVP
ncbi:hypothetical protein BKA93DRAFT_753944 [Sparassis latifolia]